MGFCVNCGAKLPDGAKFCQECGTAAVNSAPVPSNNGDNSVRKQEYVGTVLKCPNCGAVISDTTVVCEACGFHITRKEATLSVSQFKDQLMEIENNRYERKAGIFQKMTREANIADTQKLSLIRSFPIPNTIDDIQEFMLLAVANIDVSLSKNASMTKFMGFMNQGDVDKSMAKTISDAWISKMQQAYQKAEISFAGEPAFQNVKKIYIDKMKELKMI